MQDGASNQLKPATEVDPHHFWRRLNLRIKHRPNDLDLHTKRILFSLDNHLEEYSMGALSDLYVNLLGGGWHLRLRMYKLVAPVMPFTDRLYFQRWLAENSDANLKCRQFSGAVFASIHCQGQVQKRKVSHQFENKLEQSRFWIEQGELTKGQLLLEGICLDSESYRDIFSEANSELQQFYFYSKNKDALDYFLARMQNKGLEINQSWQKLQQESSSW